MKKLLRLTESDLVRLVKKVLKEQITIPTPATGEDKNTHRGNQGFQSPGFETFFANPLNDGIVTELMYELKNDKFAKGKIVIIFNGATYKDIGTFVQKIQADAGRNRCYTISNYNYNNRVALNTQITIDATPGECKKGASPVQSQPTSPSKPRKSIEQLANDSIQKSKDKMMKLVHPTEQDAQVFNQIKKELSSVVKPTVNNEKQLSFYAKFPDEVIDGKQVPIAPGTDFFFEFRPAGWARIGRLGNTEAFMSADNPEIDKLIRQLPGYNPEGYAEFEINTENMGDLLPKIKNILAKASVVGLADLSGLYPTRDRRASDNFLFYSKPRKK